MTGLPANRASAGRAASSPRRPRAVLAEARHEPPVRLLEIRADEVHRGRADELGDEEVDGAVVEPLRRVELLQHAVAHHGDAVAERHRLALVVRDVDRRHLEVALDPRDLGAHLDAQLRVEVRERLVHQERLRLAHDRAAHRHALPLPARERARLLARARPRARAPGRSLTRRPISALSIFRSFSPNAMLS